MLEKFIKSTLFCAPFALIACGDDSSTGPVKNVEHSVVTQDSSFVYDTVVINGETIITVDTIVHYDTVKVTTPSEEKAPYYVDNDVFNWDDLQDVTTPTIDVKDPVVVNSSSSAKSSSSVTSSSSYVDLISSSSETPSTVNGNTLTDGRDGQAYKVENVGGALWMAENIKFETKTGTLCKSSGEDLCAKFGMFYSKTAMKSACPKGWHLPTEAEVTAADNVVEHEWWTIAGRFKSDGSYGNEKQGYIWLANGSAFLVENYSDNDREHKVVSDTEGRYYSVRCVQD